MHQTAKQNTVETMGDRVQSSVRNSYYYDKGSEETAQETALTINRLEQVRFQTSVMLAAVFLAIHAIPEYTRAVFYVDSFTLSYSYIETSTDTKF